MNTPKMKKYAAGEIILHEGEYSTFFYKILVGTAALYKNYGKENECLIETVGTGQYFGAISILMGQPNHCTVVARESTALLPLPAENFEEFVQANSYNALPILKTFAKHALSLNHLLHELQDWEFAAVRMPVKNTQAEAKQEEPKQEEPKQEEPEQEEPEQEEAAQSSDAEDEQNFSSIVIQAHRQTDWSEEIRILPDVYPDFYLEGHQLYPNITHPEYEEFTFNREYTCPNCKNTFEGKRISYNRLTIDRRKTKELGYDFHMFYKNFEIEWYDIVTCPHCYFSSLIDVFLNPGAVRKNLYASNLTEIQDKVFLDFDAERNLDFVFMQHYIALACAPAFSNYRQITACLWMNLYWLYESMRHPEMMKAAQDKMLDSYHEMYQHCELTPEQEQRTALTIAGIYHERKNYEKAREWAFAVRSNMQGKSIYRNIAETILDNARRSLNE